MNGSHELMPRPSVIRDRLSENLREGAVLRALLRVAERAAEDGNPGKLMPDLVNQGQTAPAA